MTLPKTMRLNKSPRLGVWIKSGSGQDRTVDLTIFSRALVPTELPSQYFVKLVLATQTGLEPATSAVTGRRANQLRYWAKLIFIS
jgi:integrase